MGITHVTVTIRNPAEPARTWEGLFLVDTGAVDCLVPRPHLEAIGLAPKGQRVYGLADGSEVRMEFTTGDIEFMGGNRWGNDRLRRGGRRAVAGSNRPGIGGHRSGPTQSESPETPINTAQGSAAAGIVSAALKGSHDENTW